MWQIVLVAGFKEIVQITTLFFFPNKPGLLIERES